MNESMLKHVTIDGVRLHLNTKQQDLWINGYWKLNVNNTTNTILSILIDTYYDTEKPNVFKTAVDRIIDKFKISRSEAEQDLNVLIGIINSFSRNEVPANLIGVTTVKKQISAPTRMDLALTYRCNNRCGHCYLKENKSEKELTTEEWFDILDKLWGIGVSQVVFTGGEVFLRDDLMDLLEHSKEFVTGIISNGTLIDEETAFDLKYTDLDWVQITLESSQKSIHDEMQGRKGAYDETIKGIKNCIKAGLNVSINATLTKKNKDDIFNLIDLAKRLKVPTVSTNAIINSGRGVLAKHDIGVTEAQLQELLIRAKKYAEERDIKFNWFLPTCYKNLDPIKLGFGQRNCSAFNVNMMIQPDGTVIPCQSWTHENLGSFIRTKWEDIWNSRLANKIRAHEFADKECFDCEYFEKCGGGCPLNSINKSSCSGCGGCS